MECFSKPRAQMHLQYYVTWHMRTGTANDYRKSTVFITMICATQLLALKSIHLACINNLNKLLHTCTTRKIIEHTKNYLDILG